MFCIQLKMAATVRTGTFSEGITAEQAQDANTALAELDKGLSSGRVGIQCESVVKCPRLFEKYPFPILINSALLKLGETFRLGNNFIRLCILKVIQQSEKHLDKILNVDQFVKSVSNVLHSNDPVARAVALRLLGSMATVIPNRDSVHHSIMLSLDSHDAVEVEAGIFAAEKFSAVSKTFAASICSKIAEMISGIATPVDRKLQLIPILQHMHHDVNTATKAHGVCLSLLERYPSGKFVELTLRVMSQLAVRSLVLTHSHLQLLLSYLERDLRCSVRVVALLDLHLLAQSQPQLWSPADIQFLPAHPQCSPLLHECTINLSASTSLLKLCLLTETVSTFALKTPAMQLKVHAVRVLIALCSSVALQVLQLPEDSKLFEVARVYSYHRNLELTSKAVHLLTLLAKSQKFGPELGQEAVSAVETQILLLATATANEQQGLKLVLHCAVVLSQAIPEASCRLAATIANLLPNSRDEVPGLLCQALAALGSRGAFVLAEVAPTLLEELRRGLAQGQEPGQLQVSLCTLAFQAGGYEALSAEAHSVVLECAQRASPWLAYRIVRQAMRYTHFNVAAEICAFLTQKVSSPCFFHWLSALHSISLGERQLRLVAPDNSNLLECVARALELYQKGLVALKAAATPTFPLHFAAQYVLCRIQLLQVHRQLLLAANTLHTSPPTAIAVKGQESHRWQRVTQQMTSCKDQYEEVSKKISALHWSAFDADPASLRSVDSLQQSCDCLKTPISTMIANMEMGSNPLGDRQLFSGKKSKVAVEGSMEKALQKVTAAMETLLHKHSTARTFTPEHVLTLESCAQTLLRISHPFPRFFFQTLQTTTVKLAVSPQPKVNMEPAMSRCEGFLTLTVEGVIQRGDQPTRFQQLHALEITVSSTLTSPSISSTRSQAPLALLKGAESGSGPLTQTVRPHNDYFSTNFLLQFPNPGLHQVTITTAMVDATGAVWHTGPRATLNVKAFEETVHRVPRPAVHAPRPGTQ